MILCSSIFEICSQFNTYIDPILNIITLILLLWGWWLYVRYNYRTMTVSLMGGKYVFKVKRRHFNSTDLTTIVSNLYFKGGQIDGELRQEIFKITGTTGMDLSNNEQ